MPTALFGIGLGIVCAIISAPVTTYIWKGASLSGTDAVTAFFSAKGFDAPRQRDLGEFGH